MTKHLLHSQKSFATFFCLLFFAACSLLSPTQSKAQTRQSAQMERKVQVSFSYSPTRPMAEQTVQFKDSSRGNPTSYLWDFGDGTTSTDQNPNHAYVAPGSYRVSLIARNNSSVGKTSRTVSVLPSFSVSFTYSPAYPITGQALQFTDTSVGSPTSWQWSFGDGTTSNSQNPIHAYTKAGSYTVTLTVAYGAGNKSASQIISVSPATAPSASFTYSPSSPVEGQVVQFTDTSTGNPTSWLWNFGDNTSSNSKNPSHSYATAASYTVTLTATNSYVSSSKSLTITVSLKSTLTASFTFSPFSPHVGQVVYFTDTSTGSPISWQWNFGDGATSTSKNPSHSYASAASYTVTLTVANNSDSKSTSQTITVKPAFAASFTYSPSSPAVGQAVQFTDTSTGGPTSWQWNFGDNGTSTVQNPNHAYSAAGQYWVNLIITNGTDSQSTSQMITVSQAGIITAASPSFADVSAAITQAKPGDTVLVPSGTSTWNDHLVITKGINLIGAGKNNTIITSGYYCPNQHMQPANGYSPAQCLEQYLITFKPSNPSANEPFRLSGFTLDLASKCEGIMIVNYVYSPAITNVRIDDNKIINPAVGTNSSYPWEFGVGIVICIWGQIYGVVDNNVISGAAYFNVIGMNEYNWTNENFQFGSASNFYFEDNDITLASYDTSQACIISGAGGRWCFRYNKIHATGCPQGLWPVLDAHGNTGSGGNLALMGFEAYSNIIDIGTYNGRLVDHRGGRALVYNNNVITSGGTNILVREEYLDATNPPSTASDGETQHVCHSYYWNNTKNSSTRIDTERGSTIDYGGSIGLVPQANRDFWFQGSSFNGTTGVGVGPLAFRPSTCTTGVAYWATDEGKLYVATATNVWTLYYTPYAYPHPLRK